RALEGWEVRESQYLKSFEDRGEVKRARVDVLRVLQSRLGTPAPEPIRLAAEGTNDLGVRARWFDAALAATSWEAFQAAWTRGGRPRRGPPLPGIMVRRTRYAEARPRPCHATSSASTWAPPTAPWPTSTSSAPAPPAGASTSTPSPSP